MNPLHEDNLRAGDILISAPVPPEVDVDYLQKVSVPVSITNNADVPILIDTIALQFDVIAEASAADGRVIFQCPGGRLREKGSKYWNVPVRPNLFFREYTNCYSIAVSYRREDGGKLGKLLTITKPAGTIYLIIHTPPIAFGKVFISYKDDEDVQLAKGLFTLARRAGFDPYMAPPDLKPGAQLWDEKIQPAIKESHCVFVIWTSKTSKGTGVAREVALCRKFGKDEVLLLEEGIDVPELFKSKQVREKERERFRRSGPLGIFAEVVIARRGMIESD